MMTGATSTSTSMTTDGRTTTTRSVTTVNGHRVTRTERSCTDAQGENSQLNLPVGNLTNNRQGSNQCERNRRVGTRVRTGETHQSIRNIWRPGCPSTLTGSVPGV